MTDWDEIAEKYGPPLNTAFFERSPIDVAPELLGCAIATLVGGQITAGLIVETEAYLGSDDPGSHAATKGVTRRNAVMYGPPGTAYVYFTYGNHHMLNLVCCKEGEAGAVLIRAVEPEVGVEVMTERRRGRPEHELCDGPGKLAEALGVDLSDNGSILGTGRIGVYAGRRSQTGEISTTGRVGLRNGHELPYRFFDPTSRFVSKGRTGPLGTRMKTKTTGERPVT